MYHRKISLPLRHCLSLSLIFFAMTQAPTVLAPFLSPAIAQAEPSASDQEQLLQKQSEQQTITITKAVTGDYRPQFRPRLPAVVEGIVRRTNEFRVREKLSPLDVDETLTKTAQDFADFMAKTGKYGHQADEQTPQERVTAHGYEVCFIGENIAMQFKSNGFSTGALMKAFFDGWKNSPQHRANMLQTAVTQTGVAISQSQETGAYFAVQLVGRPMSQAIDFQVANQSSMDIVYKIHGEEFTLPPGYTRKHQLCAPETLMLIVEGQVAASKEIASGKLYVFRDQNGDTGIDVSEQPEPPSEM